LDAISSLWLAVIFIGWGWLLAYLVKSAIPAKNEEEDQALSRRQFLKVSGAGISAVALGAWGLTALFGEDAIEELAVVESDVFSGGDPFGAMGTSGPAASPSPAELAARPAPVTGTRPELTPTKDYYRIDINTRPSQVDIESWRLIVSGKISAPTEMTIDDIRALPSQTQILTMQCISNNVGGDLTSSTRWTGVKFKDLMDSLGMDPSAAGALIKGVDGFYEYVVMEDILDDRTLLVYDMNGAPLPQKHGFPLRVYIPNRYGMKQPKWIESIEITENWVEGYWVERGWSKEAFTHTVSVVDAVVVDPDGGENGIARAGGIAWASARGISKVEVKIDSGSWQEAELISPPLSPLTWVLWRIAWDYTPGRYQISVRAYDGQGQLQRSEKRSPRPDGATGLHTISVNI
jgi:DMSO/TMAO reductase YedYZ molybdopterin-dependent catalytic subunit